MNFLYLNSLFTFLPACQLNVLFHYILQIKEISSMSFITIENNFSQFVIGISSVIFFVISKLCVLKIFFSVSIIPYSYLN